MRCTYCGSNLHTINNCPKTWSGQAKRRALRCSYCGGDDHRIQACPHNANASRRQNFPDSVADHFILDKRR